MIYYMFYDTDIEVKAAGKHTQRVERYIRIIMGRQSLIHILSPLSPLFVNANVGRLSGICENINFNGSANV